MAEMEPAIIRDTAGEMQLAEKCPECGVTWAPPIGHPNVKRSAFHVAGCSMMEKFLDEADHG